MLKLYQATPFISGTEVALNDYAIGGGGVTTFPVVNKTSFQVGNVIQAASQFFLRKNGGFTIPDSSHITLKTAPGTGANIIIPGILRATFKVYDALVVGGVSGGNVSETALYLADPEDIFIQEYEPAGSDTGIRFELVLKDSNGPDLTWFQVAPANPDGTPGTYSTAGTTALFLPAMDGQTTTTSILNSGDNTFTVTNPAAIYAGGYAKIGDDTTQETVHILNITGSTVTSSRTANAYASGTNIYDDGRVVWIKTTVPTGLLNSGAFSYLNVAADVTFDAVNRS